MAPLDNVKLGNLYQPVTLNGRVEGGNYSFPSTETVSVGGVSTGNPWGISIPTSHSTTVDTTGDVVSCGQDAPGCRHISSSELAYMQQYKGEGINLLTLG